MCLQFISQQSCCLTTGADREREVRWTTERTTESLRI